VIVVATGMIHCVGGTHVHHGRPAGQRYGIGRIGLESLIMLLVYAGLVASVAL